MNHSQASISVSNAVRTPGVDLASIIEDDSSQGDT